MENNVTQINIPYPDTAEPALRISVGACKLVISPSDGNEFVKGTYTDPSGGLPCSITNDGGTVLIKQRQLWENIFNLVHKAPEFNLFIGKAKPMTLHIESGASENTFSLGGLPIRRLAMRMGASKNVVNFGSPNPEEMAVFNLSVGAGDTRMSGVLNANFGLMDIEGGASSNVLGFDGNLRRDARVELRGGVSSVSMSFPKDMAVLVSPNVNLGSVVADRGFIKENNLYSTQFVKNGQTPVLRVFASMSLGSLELSLK